MSMWYTGIKYYYLQVITVNIGAIWEEGLLWRRLTHPHF